MRSKRVSEFSKGLINSMEAGSIPDGASSSSLNWLSKLDRVELARGYEPLGSEISGVGRVSGLYVASRADATQVAFRKRGRKLEYYDAGAAAWVETGTDIFPAAAVDDEASFAEYASLAGNQLFICSPNAGPFKVMVANPGSYADMHVAATNFRGRIKIKQNRCWLWGRNEDRTGIYGSYVDDPNYTTVTAEATTSLTGTLAFKAGGARRTCFGVAITITATSELYTDDYSGNLTGSLGGTGTINYMTGAYTLSNPGVGTADYQWEDSTDDGVMDFTKSAPRLAGQGFTFRQDDGGGEAMSVESYGDVEYCLHRHKTWALTLTATDTNATNLIYRDRVGIPNPRAAVSTGEGVYYVDDLDETDPKFRLLTLQQGSTAVVPLPVSDQLNLVDYRFDLAATHEWGDYVVFACRHRDSAANDTVFAYNKRYRLWDRLDYYVSCFATYNGALVAGDSVSYNVYELFSGFDFNGSPATNHWEGSLTDLQVEELKKTRKFWVEGEISRDQSLAIYLSVDDGPFVLAGTQAGSDPNVDPSPRTVIGSDAIGSGTIGGSTSTSAHHYVKEIRPRLGRFRTVKARFEAGAIGYLSVSAYTHYDITLAGQRLPQKYRSQIGS